MRKEAIERLRNSLDLVSVVESRGVTLARKGRNLFGRCPFHDDRTPSLVVNPERQLWNCLGACRNGEKSSGGDVFAFVMRFDRVEFPEALRKLSSGNPVEEPGNEGRRRLRRPSEAASTRDAALLARVAEHYHRAFRERREGQDYLRSRGIDDPEVLRAFQVGFADGSLLTTFGAEGETAEALWGSGILTARSRELFAGCVVFPLSLPDAGVVGFYGRHTTRDQHLYLPGPRRGVFHWQALKGSDEIILTESILDALTLYQAGFRNVSAVYGVHGCTADHTELLQRFRVRRVFLCLDNDDAGSAATADLAMRLATLGLDTADIRVEGAKDPNALFQAIGRDAATDAVRARIERARKAKPATASPLSEKAVDKSSATGPTVTREEGGGFNVAFPERTYRVRGLTAKGLDRLKVNVAVRAGTLGYPETLDLYVERARTRFIDRVAQELDCDRAMVAREVGELIAELDRLRLHLDDDPERAAGTVEVSDRDREDALVLLRAPNLIERVVSDFGRVGFVGEETALTVGYLGTISRFLDDPLALLIVSRSGAGKSTLQDALCDFVPEESLARYTRVTGQALFYTGESSLRHKVLSIAEDGGAEAAAYSIRNLQSAQALKIAATRTDPTTGKLKAEEYEVKGPVFIMLTTTAPEALDFETRNRFVQLGIDESREQTRRILARQREGDTLDGILRREEGAAIRRKHQNAQRLLRPLKVVNPFAPSLVYPDERLQMRREQRKYLALIRSIALLHQHQREIKRVEHDGQEVEYVEVVPSDIALANRLARAVLGRSLDELAQPTRLLLKHLAEMTRGHAPRRFTRQDIRDATGWSDHQVRTHLAHLLTLEYVVLASGPYLPAMDLHLSAPAEEGQGHVRWTVPASTSSSCSSPGSWSGCGSSVGPRERSIPIARRFVSSSPTSTPKRTWRN